MHAQLCVRVFVQLLSFVLPLSFRFSFSILWRRICCLMAVLQSSLSSLLLLLIFLSGTLSLFPPNPTWLKCACLPSGVLPHSERQIRQQKNSMILNHVLITG